MKIPCRTYPRRKPANVFPVFGTLLPFASSPVVMLSKRKSPLGRPDILRIQPMPQDFVTHLEGMHAAGLGKVIAEGERFADVEAGATRSETVN